MTSRVLESLQVELQPLSANAANSDASQAAGGSLVVSLVAAPYSSVQFDMSPRVHVGATQQPAVYRLQLDAAALRRVSGGLWSSPNFAFAQLRQLLTASHRHALNTFTVEATRCVLTLSAAMQSTSYRFCAAPVQADGTWLNLAEHAMAMQPPTAAAVPIGIPRGSGWTVGDATSRIAHIPLTQVLHGSPRRSLSAADLSGTSATGSSATPPKSRTGRRTSVLRVYRAMVRCPRHLDLVYVRDCCSGRRCCPQL